MSQSEMILLTINKSAAEVNQNWISTQPETHFNHDRTTYLLDQFVKKYMFHAIVFILSPSLILFSKHELLLCQLICNHLNVPQNKQEHFWMYYAKYVEKCLN